MKTKIRLLLIITVLSFTIRSVGQTYSNTTIYTPNWTSVPALLLISGELTSAEKAASRAYWEWYYDYRISFESEATRTYNCHAYAWWVSEGHSAVWLNDPSDFWEDDSYIEIASQADATKVSFGTADHSAITTGTEDYFESKWGESPRFSHDVSDCPYDDSDLHYYIRPYISGATLLCTAGSSYTINDLPAECSVTWSCGGYISRVSAQGSNPCTFQASGTGDSWINATIISDLDTIVLPEFDVWAGKAQVQSISGPSSTTPYSYNYYYANVNHSAGTTYNWMVSPTGPYVDPSPGEVNSCLVIFYTSGSYQVLAQAVNACGTSTWCPKYVYVSGGKSMSMSPNPASEYVTITIKEDLLLYGNENITTEKNLKPGGTKNYKIRIYNNQGLLVTALTRYGNTFNIAIQNMPDGVYIVELDDGQTLLREQLVVKH